jgi:FMN phosphatase YigB (HAD superfamily)
MGFTLVDLRSNYDRELIAVAARAGYEITLDDVRRAMTDVWAEQLRLESVTMWEPSQAADDAISLDIDRRVCLHLGIPDPQMHQKVHAMAGQIFHDPATYYIFPDVFPTLEALRSLGLRLGIVSNWDWCLPDLCEILGLTPYFDFIVASARVGAAKPHPAIFQAALREAGSDPDETLHAGDNLAADVRGAQAVGITGVWLDRGCTNAAPEDYPVVCRLDQLLALLA